MALKLRDKNYINRVVSSVVNLHIQKIAVHGDKNTIGKLSFNEIRERVTPQFVNEVDIYLSGKGLNTSYDEVNKLMNFSFYGVNSVELNLEQREEAVKQLEAYNRYNPSAVNDVLDN